jgi:hypothetical protein
MKQDTRNKTHETKKQFQTKSSSQQKAVHNIRMKPRSSSQHPLAMQAGNSSSEMQAGDAGWQ